MNKKGFTLVELLAVIVILAILATAAFTLVIPRITKAKKDTFLNEARALIDASMPYFLEHENEAEVSIQALISGGYASVKGDANKYKGTITHEDNEYQIDFNNGTYQTDGFVSLNELNADNIYEVGNEPANQVTLDKNSFKSIKVLGEPNYRSNKFSIALSSSSYTEIYCDIDNFEFTFYRCTNNDESTTNGCSTNKAKYKCGDKIEGNDKKSYGYILVTPENYENIGKNKIKIALSEH